MLNYSLSMKYEIKASFSVTCLLIKSVQCIYTKFLNDFELSEQG